MKDTNNDCDDNTEKKEAICPISQKADTKDMALQLEQQVALPSTGTENDIERDIIAQQQAILDDINDKNRARSNISSEDLDVKNRHDQPKTAPWTNQNVITNDDENSCHDERDDQEQKQERSDIVASCSSPFEYDYLSCISGKKLWNEEVLLLVQEKLLRSYNLQLQKQTHADHDEPSLQHEPKCEDLLRCTDLIYEEEDSKPPARKHYHP